MCVVTSSEVTSNASRTTEIRNRLMFNLLHRNQATVKRKCCTYFHATFSHCVKIRQVGVLFLEIKPPLAFVTNSIRLVTKSRHPLTWYRSWAVKLFSLPCLVGCTYPLATLVKSLTRNTRFFQSSYYHCQNNGPLNVRQMGVENVSLLPTYLQTYSLTHSLHGTGCYLKSWLSLRLSKNILLLESEGSLPCSQKSATGPYPEPAESSSPHRSLSP